jgi:hypothetical protein
VYAFAITAYEILTRNLPWLEDEASMLSTGHSARGSEGTPLPIDEWVGYRRNPEPITAAVQLALVQDLPGKTLSGARPFFGYLARCLPAELVQLVYRCWAPRPGDRPTTTSILKSLHDVIDSITLGSSSSVMGSIDEMLQAEHDRSPGSPWPANGIS